MELEIEFKNCWVSIEDIIFLESVLGKSVDSYFKQKRDFDCFSYQGKLVHNFSIKDIKNLFTYYWRIELNASTLIILNN